ncbi:unnamed protein product [Caenorhabditis auriculariae]|uniref:TIP41-like protein n=1 Tax=Caenorhabditis auriculariae TaxID=2777116 RepID=A0A8S1H8W0_9PELO|nr:unnamed protein product [Caenorhabditis auriculariae]
MQTPFPRTAQEVLAHARSAAKKQERFVQGGFTFENFSHHILDSLCRHTDADSEASCSKCTFERELELPELPEMVFPKNVLRITFPNGVSAIEFRALDALKMVCPNKLPDVQVGPSLVWQEARKDRLQMITESHHPYDWTFTTHYNGTLIDCHTEETDERIDMERLKQRDEIKFFAETTLFEDELADHGTAELSAKLRVMDKNYFFLLLRFYMRVDGVLVRVCDTRIVGDSHKDYVIREWQLREAKFSDLPFARHEDLNNVNLAWQHLPVVKSFNEKIVPN